MPHKLLLADDSVTIQKVIELTFADEDIEVVAASDGKQALDMLPAERPDIVLADVGMPERDGYDVAAFIKGRPDLSHIPVLLLTGAFEPIDEGRARASGCDGVLVKPFEPQMVINRVKELIAGRRPAAGMATQSTPARAAVPPQPGMPAAEYFDHLDSVFAREAPPARPPAPRPAPAAPVGSIAGVPSAGSAPVGTTARPPASAPTLAEAFAALLAAEQGKVAPPPPVNEQALREDVIEEVTRRVIGQMTDAAVREVALEVAERVVREEIERIKTQSR